MIRSWTIAEYVAWYQPDIIRLLWLAAGPAGIAEDELTPEQEYLARLMRQRPRPGRG